MVITTKQGVKLLITRGLVGLLLRIKVSEEGQQLEQTSFATPSTSIHHQCDQGKVITSPSPPSPPHRPRSDLAGCFVSNGRK